ncbi:MAG: methionyl-tRNA formyltransferase [Cyanobacteria bacterium TGS_CYA1]|nr:methionyl-tRNA formyltransferase [Cyanobacteria bacterium TGS_CYA1]
MKVIFLGTPQIAVPTLEALFGDKFFEVVGVLCQPDRPKGRGNKVTPPAVKEALQRLDPEGKITLWQPEKLSRSPEIVEQMKAKNADAMVMVAFGQILKKDVLEMTPHGVINFHGSLLPKYRGAAPINWVIINGEKTTGVTTMRANAGVDTGDMLERVEFEIKPEWNAIDLAEHMSTAGAPLVISTLKGLADGSVKPVVQDDSQATYAPMLDKEMANIDWMWAATTIHNTVRGLVPWPGTVCQFRGAPLKIWQTKLVEKSELETIDVPSKTQGTIINRNHRVFAVCGNNGLELIELCEVQPPGKPKMKAQDWANGAHLAKDDCLLKV